MYTLWCSLSNALALPHSVSLIPTQSPTPSFRTQTFFTVRNVLEEKRQRRGLLIPAGLGFKHHTCVAFRFRCRSLFISPSKVIHKNAIIVLSELCQLLFDSVVKGMARVRKPPPVHFVSFLTRWFSSEEDGWCMTPNYATFTTHIRLTQNSWWMIMFK